MKKPPATTWEEFRGPIPKGPPLKQAGIRVQRGTISGNLRKFGEKPKGGGLMAMNDSVEFQKFENQPSGVFHPQVLYAMIQQVTAAGYAVEFEAMGTEWRCKVYSGREGDRKEDTGPTREGALAKVMTAMGWDLEG